MIFCTLRILSLCAIYSLGAFASPTSDLTPSLSITRPTNTTSISNDNLHCIDLINPFSHRPKYPDCVLAIRQLPQYPASGAFHNHGIDDPFKLPVEKTLDSCTIRIELYAGSSTESASWSGVTARANALNRSCLRTFFPIYKGGWATFGKHDRIVISLAYRDRWDEGAIVPGAR